MPLLKMIKKTCHTFIEILNLPALEISLNGEQEIYECFNAPHGKYPLIRNKMIGVALFVIDEKQHNWHKMKKNCNQKVNRAKKGGYVFSEIEPENHLEDIYLINTSTMIRQGRPMSDNYTRKQTTFIKKHNCKYFGVFNSNKELVAYCWVTICGELWILGTLLGHAEHLSNGIMYLLITEIIHGAYGLSDKERPKYMMYDTWFGASDGLKRFKKRLGFKPYKVRWRL